MALTRIGNNAVPAGAVTQHVTDTDLQPVKSDISALALREATNEASASFNLPNQFIDTFATDTLGTKTDIIVNSGHLTSGTQIVPTVSGTGNSSNANPEWSINTTTGLITHTTGSTTHNSTDAGCYYCIVDYGQDVTMDSGLMLQLQSGNVIYSSDKNLGVCEFNVKNNANAWLFGSGGITPTQNEYITSNNWITHGGTGLANLYDQTNDYKGRYTSIDNHPASQKYTWTSGSGQISGRYIYVGFTNTYAQIATFKIFDNASGGLNTGDNILLSTHFNTPSATGTAIQDTNTVGSAKTKVGGTMLYKDNAGTATLGTDLKIYFTCNGGTNWTEASSYNAITPVYSTGIKQVRLGETTCTSGTDVRYKAVWANQSSGSKETQLHGIGINY